MTVRWSGLKVLSLEEAHAAAERICSHPSVNAQRVSMNETYSMAQVTRQYVELGRLAALQLAGRATAQDGAALHRLLTDAGFLVASLPATATAQQGPKETTHAD